MTALAVLVAVFLLSWIVRGPLAHAFFSATEAGFVRQALHDGGLVDTAPRPLAAEPLASRALDRLGEAVGFRPDSLRAAFLFCIFAAVAAAAETQRRAHLSATLVLAACGVSLSSAARADLVRPEILGLPLASLAMLAMPAGLPRSLSRVLLAVAGAAGCAAVVPGAAAPLALLLLAGAAAGTRAHERIAALAVGAGGLLVASLVHPGILWDPARPALTPAPLLAVSGVLPWTPGDGPWSTAAWIALPLLAGLATRLWRRTTAPFAAGLLAAGAWVVAQQGATIAPMSAAVLGAALLHLIGRMVDELGPQGRRLAALTGLGFAAWCAAAAVPTPRQDVVATLTATAGMRIPATALVLAGNQSNTGVVAVRLGHHPGMPVIALPEDVELEGLAQFCRSRGLAMIWMTPAGGEPPPGFHPAKTPLRPPPDAAPFQLDGT